MIKQVLQIYLTLTGVKAEEAQLAKKISGKSHPEIYMQGIAQELKEAPKELIDKTRAIIHKEIKKTTYSCS